MSTAKQIIDKALSYVGTYDGGTTTNIYLDEPLEESESISMSDTGVSIPTINGSNTLSIGTAVQPSKVFIKYGGSSNVNQSLMRYLEYKYDFSKE